MLPHKPERYAYLNLNRKITYRNISTVFVSQASTCILSIYKELSEQVSQMARGNMVPLMWEFRALQEELEKMKSSTPVAAPFCDRERKA